MKNKRKKFVLVKIHESGVVANPVTVSPQTTLAQIKELTAQHGFAGYPVVEESGELVGIITGRDIVFETDFTRQYQQL